MSKNFYSVQEVCDIFGNVMCRGTIYGLVRRGEIPSARIGKKVIVPAYWVDEFLKKNGVAHG